MTRYYCPYCKMYLNHGTPSVVKSHRKGKGHIRCYGEYYEEIARQHPELDTTHNASVPAPEYEYCFEDHYRGMPGLASEEVRPHSERSKPDFYDEKDPSIHPPPPPPGTSLPPPPPPVFNCDQEAEQRLKERYIESHTELKPDPQPEERFKRRSYRDGPRREYSHDYRRDAGRSDRRW